MTNLLQLLKLAIPHEPHCIVAYVVSALFLVGGAVLIVQARRTARLRNEGGRRVHIHRAE